MQRASNFNTNGIGVVHEYSLLCSDITFQLRNALPSQIARDLVVTARYLAAGSVQVPAAAHMMIRDDLEDFKQKLGELIDELKTLKSRWTEGDVLVVPDTNVFMEHKELFDLIDWHELLDRAQVGPHRDVRLVVPMVVVDELDRLKRTNDRTRARHSLSVIERFVPGRPGKPAILRESQRSDSGEHTGFISVEVLVDEPDHIRLPDNDGEIVDQAAMLRDLTGKRVLVVTGDTGMLIRAKSEGLQIVKLEESDRATKSGKTSK